MFVALPGYELRTDFLRDAFITFYITYGRDSFRLIDFFSYADLRRFDVFS